MKNAKDLTKTLSILLIGIVAGLLVGSAILIGIDSKTQTADEWAYEYAKKQMEWRFSPEGDSIVRAFRGYFINMNRMIDSSYEEFEKLWDVQTGDTTIYYNGNSIKGKFSRIVLTLE